MPDKRERKEQQWIKKHSTRYPTTYIVCSKNEEKTNGQVANALFQVTLNTHHRCQHQQTKLTHDTSPKASIHRLHP